MRDQVDALRSKGIKAVAIHSALSKFEIDVALDNCIYGDYKFLYLSPERLGTDLFRARLKHMKVNLLAVDEAHCISQWGYDFRPSYLKIAEIRQELPGVPVLALTATATPAVADDIQKQLSFNRPNVIRQSFERKNLAYRVIQTEDKYGNLLKVLKKHDGSGIVYVRSRKKTREVSDFLTRNKISAGYYHAGLDSKLRQSREKSWQYGDIRVMVSTNAFGMGIDKANVRVVIHLDLPDSPEAYFQEAGRAGRDGNKAESVLLYHSSDKKSLQQSLVIRFPGIEKIRQVYTALGHYYQLIPGAGKGQAFDFNLGDFCMKFGLHTLTTYHALKHIERAGFIELTEEINLPARLYFRINRDDLYKFQVANSRYDGIIKLLLRLYSGLFTDFCKIDLDFIAARAKVKSELIKQVIESLQGMGIVYFLEPKKTPQIIFIAEKVEEKSLIIPKDVYDWRYKESRNRLDTMIHYGQSANRCRSQLLLMYFGDKNPPPCDICDICEHSADSELTQKETTEIGKQILALIEDGPKTRKELINSLDIPLEKVGTVLDNMLDRNQLLIDKGLYKLP
jgi:ATP-dependent DNA helicase RecQ